jgi:histidinol-phosphatase (PHP family)
VALRLGIEIDFVPGQEERMDADSTALPYDYVIGSVHRVDGDEVDRATDQSVYERYETYELYAAYYRNVREAALSGRFEVIGHPTSSRSSAATRTGTSPRCSRRPPTPSPSPASSWT